MKPLTTLTLLTTLLIPTLASAHETLKIYPTNAKMHCGDTLQFTATLQRNDGSTYTPKNLQWYTTGGTINPNGLYTAPQTSGTYKIEARLPSIQASATIYILPPNSNAQTIEILPKSPTLFLGQTFTFQAIGKNSLQHKVPIQPLWSVTGGGNIHPHTGQFQPTTTGTFQVICLDQKSQKVAIASFQILPPPKISKLKIIPTTAKILPNTTLTLKAIAYNHKNQPIPTKLPLLWKTNPPAKITPNGTFSTPQPGKYWVVCLHPPSHTSAKAKIQVLPPPPKKRQLHHIQIQPPKLTLRVGEKFTFQAIGRDKQNQPVPFEPLWTCEEEDLLNNQGTFFAKRKGTFQILVMDLDTWKQAQATVKVLPAIAKIQISPPYVKLNLGKKFTFHAKAYDKNGHPTPFQPRWSTNGGTINSNGLYTATKAGTFFVYAKSRCGKSTQATVKVLPPPRLRLLLYPKQAKIYCGQAIQFRAYTLNPAGQTLRSYYLWSASAGKITPFGFFVAPYYPTTVRIRVHDYLHKLTTTATIKVLRYQRRR